MAWVTTADLAAALKRIAASMQDKADELNAADGALGDLGITVSRGFAEAAAVDLPEDFGIAFLECSKAMQRVCASSYGTLLATAFLATAKATKGRTCLQTTEISSLVDGALAAMMARGKGALGDKSVLDIHKAIVDATLDAPPADLYARTLGAARKTLEDYKGKPNKLGRARMFGEASIGVYDPGQLAMVRIIEALQPGQ
jgi:phosphoenolpyruvate---glycerone phosphotransferase subunit DhaL